MINFTMTKPQGADWAIKTRTADGSLIVIHYSDHTDGPCFSGLDYNGTPFEYESDMQGLFVTFGTVFVYELVALNAVVEEANTKIADMIAEAEFAQALEEEAANRAYEADEWLRSPTQTGRI